MDHEDLNKQIANAFQVVYTCLITLKYMGCYYTWIRVLKMCIDSELTTRFTVENEITGTNAFSIVYQVGFVF